MTGLAYADLTEDGGYHVSAQCGACGKELITADDVKKPEWTKMHMSAPLNAPNCDNPDCTAVASFSDCNNHLNLVWSPQQHRDEPPLSRSNELERVMMDGASVIRTPENE
jgi:hypothetical protein